MARKRKTRKVLGMVCNMDFAKYVAGLVLLAIGVYITLSGLVAQFKGASYYVIAWYFVGLFLAGFAMWLKWSAHHDCKVHGNMEMM